MKRRLAAMVLVFEAITCGLAIPVAAQVSGSGPAVLLLTAIALLSLVSPGGLGRGWGYPLGWTLQGAQLVGIVFLPALAFVAVPFVALWSYCMYIGARIDREREQGHAPVADADTSE